MVRFTPKVLKAFLTSSKRLSTGSCRRPMKHRVTCVASVSVLLRSKERPRNEILGFGRARNETRGKKWKRGQGEGKEGNACRQTPRFWKPAFASERSAWLARLLHMCRWKVCSDLMRARIPRHSLFLQVVCPFRIARGPFVLETWRHGDS